ncbi:MAG: FG-GAP-like repeat-containing protein [Syntrophothermus sp.]
MPSAILNFSQGGLSWGDFDKDGDLDVAISGYTANYVPMTAVYRNKNGEFLKMDQTIPGLTVGSVNWGDYDNDNDLDLLICGTNSMGDGKTLLFENENSTFTEKALPFTGIARGEAIWMDYNNDGNLDILISGDTLYNTPVIRLYKNNGDETFSVVSQDLVPVLEGSATTGDYDNDGDQDIFVSGTADTGFVCFLYRNDNGHFHNTGNVFYPVSYSDAVFVDYDSDGDLDLVYMGSTMVADYRVKIYRNDGDGQFTCSSDSLEGEWVGRIDAADINNDGFPDLGITGALCCGDALTRIYMNDGNGHFYESGVPLPDLYFSNINFGDFDNDGDADFLLCGIPPDGPGNELTRLYRNATLSNTFTINQPPAIPDGLQAELDGNDVTFTWNASQDITTPSAALTYSLRIGSTPGNDDILNPMTDPVTGFNKVYRPGNLFQNTSWTIKDLASGTYYCAVQAMDHSCMASGFSPEVSFEILVNGTGKETETLTIFPVPAREALTINLPEKADPSSVRIIDPTGRAIPVKMMILEDKIRIDLSNLGSGLYILELVSGKETNTARFIVQ